MRRLCRQVADSALDANNRPFRAIRFIAAIADRRDELYASRLLAADSLRDTAIASITTADAVRDNP
ncbi:MAG: hypothetical protein ACLP50_30815 [Solirubrobacteraceae bacterium]